MAKGNRQRSNKKVVDTKKVNSKEVVVPASPVSGDKPKNKLPDIYEKMFAKYPVKPLDQRFVQMAQEAGNLSSQYATLVNKVKEVSQKVKRTRQKIRDIKSGKIHFPVFERYDDVTMTAIYDKEEYLKVLNNRIKSTEKMMLMVEDQVAHWYDEYHDSLLRLNTYVNNKLANDKELHNVMGHRKLGKDIKTEEEKLFEDDFNKSIDDLTTEEKEKILSIPKHNSKQDTKTEIKPDPKLKDIVTKN